MRIVVIGAGAAGMAAATRAKRFSPDSEVIVVEAGREFSRGTCSLPYYLSGELEDERHLQGISLEQVEQQGTQLLLETRALQIEPAPRRLVTTGPLLNFDKLIVSVGSAPRTLSHLGLPLEHPNVWSLRTIADVRKARAGIAHSSIRRVAVIGGGYVGIEAAEALTRRGLEVSIFQAGPQLAKLAPDIGSALTKLLSHHGIEVQTDCEVVAADPDSGILQVCQSQGDPRPTLPFQAFMVCCGSTPDTELLRSAGARLGESGAVRVTERGETGLSNIYACGDGVEVPGPLGGQGRWIPLATMAARLGRVCGENAAGGSLRLGSTAGALAVRVFEQELGIVGLPQDWAECRAVPFQWGNPNHSFQARREGTGIIYVDRRRDTVKGLQALGPEASRLVDLASFSVEHEVALSELERGDYFYNPPLAGLWHPFYFAARNANREKVLGGAHS